MHEPSFATCTRAPGPGSYLYQSEPDTSAFSVADGNIVLDYFSKKQPRK